MTTADEAIGDKASYIYSGCADEMTVSPSDTAPGMWDVFDGPGGTLVDTVSTAVLQYVEDNFDMPVQMIDGSDWTPSA